MDATQTLAGHRLAHGTRPGALVASRTRVCAYEISPTVIRAIGIALVRAALAERGF